MDCSPPGSSIHGILQARILEWVVISVSRGSSWPRDWTADPRPFSQWQLLTIFLQSLDFGRWPEVWPNVGWWCPPWAWRGLPPRQSSLAGHPARCQEWKSSGSKSKRGERWLRTGGLWSSMSVGWGRCSAEAEEPKPGWLPARPVPCCPWPSRLMAVWSLAISTPLLALRALPAASRHAPGRVPSAPSPTPLLCPA